MQIQSQIIEQTDSAYVLEITLEEEHKVWAYLAISEPDLDAVAQIVPPEQFEAGGDVHVMAIAQAEDAPREVEEVLFSMNPNDTVVFLCADEASVTAVLNEFGQTDSSSN
ncbi:hypothetical protein E5C31_03800 [Providencia rettgeri]|uniref:DUF4442 domain-containing protein n=1 Tax=Alcaligenes parafaecalis TaxID=171260 RepID=A0ABT3VJE5_9BURK|nr:DUF4442 domain-containing protein [Alcaligenes parafaecalis]MBY6345083.1 hypothetical protein [Providencia rettgeri]MCX5463408.1 DUF4442 domain-containing protein [Alcaligenes parafaecalis]